MHTDSRIATSAIRVSLDEANTLAEADAFNKAFDTVYAKFAKLDKATV
jgi:cysteine desulfurase